MYMLLSTWFHAGIMKQSLPLLGQQKLVVLHHEDVYLPSAGVQSSSNTVLLLGRISIPAGTDDLLFRDLTC